MVKKIRSAGGSGGAWAAKGAILGPGGQGLVSGRVLARGRRGRRARAWRASAWAGAWGEGVGAAPALGRGRAWLRWPSGGASGAGAAAGVAHRRRALGVAVAPGRRCRLVGPGARRAVTTTTPIAATRSTAAASRQSRRRGETTHSSAGGGGREAGGSGGGRRRDDRRLLRAAGEPSSRPHRDALVFCGPPRDARRRRARPSADAARASAITRSTTGADQPRRRAGPPSQRRPPAGGLSPWPTEGLRGPGGDDRLAHREAALVGRVRRVAAVAGEDGEHEEARAGGRRRSPRSTRRQRSVELLEAERERSGESAASRKSTTRGRIAARRGACPPSCRARRSGRQPRVPASPRRRGARPADDQQRVVEARAERIIEFWASELIVETRPRRPLGPRERGSVASSVASSSTTRWPSARARPARRVHVDDQERVPSWTSSRATVEPTRP